MQFLLARKLRLSMSWERAVFAQTSFLLGTSSSPSSIPSTSSSVPFEPSSVSSYSFTVEDINSPDDGEATIAFVVEGDDDNADADEGEEYNNIFESETIYATIFR
ncbi:hypothetical protein F4703DRAFT_1367699 [Phycomyces blakesleeanus]